MNKFDKPHRYFPVIDQKKIIELFNLVSKLDTYEILQYSLNNNITLNVSNVLGDSLIHEVIRIDSKKATEHAKLNVIKFLYSKNANPDHFNNENQTPLHLACKYQLKLIVDYLLSINANINVQDIYGNTPLHLLLIGKHKILDNTNEVLDFIPPPKKFNNKLKEKTIELKKKIWNLIEKESKNTDTFDDTTNDSKIPFLTTIEKTINNLVIDDKESIERKLFTLKTISELQQSENQDNLPKIKETISANRKFIHDIIKKKFDNLSNLDLEIHQKNDTSWSPISSSDNLSLIKNGNIKRVIKRDIEKSTTDVFNLNTNFERIDEVPNTYWNTTFLNYIYQIGNFSQRTNFYEYSGILDPNNQNNIHDTFKHPLALDYASSIFDFNNLKYVGGPRNVEIVETDTAYLDKDLNYLLGSDQEFKKILYLLASPIIINEKNIIEYDKIDDFWNNKDFKNPNKYKVDNITTISDSQANDMKWFVILAYYAIMKPATFDQIEQKMIKNAIDYANKIVPKTTELDLFIKNPSDENIAALKLKSSNHIIYLQEFRKTFPQKWIKCYKNEQIGSWLISMWCDLMCKFSNSNLDCKIPFKLLALAAGLNQFGNKLYGVYNVYKPQIINLIHTSLDHLDKLARWVVLLFKPDLPIDFYDKIKSTSKFDPKELKELKELYELIININNNDKTNKNNLYIKYKKSDDVKENLCHIILEMYKEMKDKPLKQTILDTIYLINSQNINTFSFDQFKYINTNDLLTMKKEDDKYLYLPSSLSLYNKNNIDETINSDLPDEIQKLINDLKTDINNLDSSQFPKITEAISAFVNVYMELASSCRELLQRDNNNNRNLDTEQLENLYRRSSNLTKELNDLSAALNDIITKSSKSFTSYGNNVIIGIQQQYSSIQQAINDINTNIFTIDQNQATSNFISNFKVQLSIIEYSNFLNLINSFLDIKYSIPAKDLNTKILLIELFNYLKDTNITINNLKIIDINLHNVITKIIQDEIDKNNSTIIEDIVNAVLAYVITNTSTKTFTIIDIFICVMLIYSFVKNISIQAAHHSIFTFLSHSSINPLIPNLLPNLLPTIIFFIEQNDISDLLRLYEAKYKFNEIVKNITGDTDKLLKPLLEKIIKILEKSLAIDSTQFLVTTNKSCKEILKIESSIKINRNHFMMSHMLGLYYEGIFEPVIFDTTNEVLNGNDRYKFTRNNNHTHRLEYDFKNKKIKPNLAARNCELPLKYIWLSDKFILNLVMYRSELTEESKYNYYNTYGREYISPTIHSYAHMLLKNIYYHQNKIFNFIQYINKTVKELESAKTTGLEKLYTKIYPELVFHSKLLLGFIKSFNDFKQSISNVTSWVNTIFDRNFNRISTYSSQTLARSLNEINSSYYLYYYIHNPKKIVKLSRFNYYQIPIDNPEKYEYFSNKDSNFDPYLEIMQAGGAESKPIDQTKGFVHQFSLGLYNQMISEFSNGLPTKYTITKEDFIQMKNSTLPPSLYNNLDRFYKYSLIEIIKSITKEIDKDNDIYKESETIIKSRGLDANIELLNYQFIAKIIEELIKDQINVYLQIATNNSFRKLIGEKTPRTSDGTDILFSVKDITVNLANTSIDVSKVSLEDYKNMYSLVTQLDNNQDIFILYQNDFTNLNKLKTIYGIEINIDIIKSMENNGASFYLKSNEFITPTFSIIKNYNWDIIKKLKENPYNIDFRDLYSENAEEDIRNINLLYIKTENLNNLNKVLDNYDINKDPISKVLSNIDEYLYLDVKTIILSNQAFGNNILSNLKYSFNLSTYLTLQLLSESLLLINENFTEDNYNKLLELLEIDKLTEIKSNYWNKASKKLKVDDDFNIIIARKLLIEKKKEKIQLEKKLKFFTDAKSKITSLDATKSYRLIDEKIKNLDLEIKKIELSIPTSLKLFNDPPNSTTILNPIDRYSENFDTSKIGIHFELWKQILDYKIEIDGKNWNLIPIFILIKQYKLIDKFNLTLKPELEEIKKSLEHLSNIAEDYFKNPKYTKQNFGLKYVNKMLIYLTKITIGNSIELILRRIFLTYLKDAMNSDDLKQVNINIKYWLEEDFAGILNSDGEKTSLLKYLYNEICPKLVKNNAEIFEDKSEEAGFVSQTTREILLGYFNLFDELNLPENVIGHIKKEVTNYLDTIIGKTILLWHVNFENILKFFINNYRCLETFLQIM